VPLVKLSEQDDVEAFLQMSERVMRSHGVQPEQWAAVIAPYLTGKAQQVYCVLGDEKCDDYQAVKQAILRRYNVTHETYRRRKFWEVSKAKDESYHEFAICLLDHCDRWCQRCKTLEDVKQLFAVEQLLTLCHQTSESGLRKGPQDLRRNRKAGRRLCGRKGAMPTEYSQVVAAASKALRNIPRSVHEREHGAGGPV